MLPSSHGHELRQSLIFFQVCGGNLEEDHGIIQSPGYPGNYPHNRDCVWTVSTTPGRTITFSLGQVNIEHHSNCSYDYLFVSQNFLFFFTSSMFSLGEVNKEHHSDCSYDYILVSKALSLWFWRGPRQIVSWPNVGPISGPIFCLLLGVSSDYAQPITGQVTEVTCPVIGQAQPELTLSKRQKIGPELSSQFCLGCLCFYDQWLTTLLTFTDLWWFVG